MVHGKKEAQHKEEDMDQWLEQFFLDPLTSYLDEAEFRIDLFETAEEYIIEALLPAYQIHEIDISLESNTIRIQVQKEHQEKNIKQRKIPFPFPVINHRVTAVFHDDILEVFVAKNILFAGTNRKVSIKQ